MTEQQFLSIEEVAKRLELNSSTVYRLVREGQLPGFKIGGQWRFSEKALEEWATNQVNLKRLQAEEKKRKRDDQDQDKRRSA
jgi:excisionase family DNA binding protein